MIDCYYCLGEMKDHKDNKDRKDNNDDELCAGASH